MLNRTIIFIFFICSTTFAIAQPANTTAKYATIFLKSIDTNSAEIKTIIYKLDSFYNKRVAAGVGNP